MNKQIKIQKKIWISIGIILICFILCFLSGILMILVSNQNKIIAPLKIICFFGTLFFGIMGLANLFSLIRYLFVEENEQTDKKLKYKTPPQICKK